VKVEVYSADRPTARRDLGAVLGIQDTGASPFGSTFYKSLLSCPREHALRYHVGLVPDTTADQLATGWLWHYCLQRHYEVIHAFQKKSNAKATSPEFLWGGEKQGQIAAYAVVEVFEKEPGYEAVTADVRRMLDTYFNRYSQQDQWRIIAVEETLIYDREIRYSARLDLIVEDLDRGGLWIVEHKTARSVTSDLLDNYQLDLQILGQVWLLKHCANMKRLPHFLGVKINIATKHKLPQLIRIDVSPSDAHLQAFYASQRQWQKLKEYMEKLGWPRSLGHCSGFNRGYTKCTYFNLCHGHPQRNVADWQQESAPYGFVKKPVDKHLVVL
jgi:hypothetical protein